MAKIIKAGTRLTWYVGRQVHCIRCGCEFEIEVSDKVQGLKSNDVAQMVQMPCPQCQSLAVAYYNKNNDNKDDCDNKDDNDIESNHYQESLS